MEAELFLATEIRKALTPKFDFSQVQDKSVF